MNLSNLNCFNYKDSNTTEFEKILLEKICTIEKNVQELKNPSFSRAFFKNVARTEFIENDIKLIKILIISILVIVSLLFINVIIQYIYCLYKNIKNKKNIQL